MASRSLERSMSAPGDDSFVDKSHTLLRQRSKRNSVFSFINLIRPPETPPPPDTPGAAEHEELLQKQEDAWMQACYNTVALVFIFIAGCICVAVYYVLERFLHPLLWAVLIGTFLHPFKHSSTMKIKEWLESLESSGVPLSAGIIISPFLFFNGLAEFMEYRIMYYWKSRLYVVIIMAGVWIAYSVSLPLYVYNGTTVLSAVFQNFDSFVSRTAFLQLCTVVVGFAVLIFLSRHSEHTATMKVLALVLWFVVVLNATMYLVGRVALPAVTTLFITGAITDQFWKAKSKKVEFTRESGQVEEGDRTGERNILEKGITLKTAQSVSVDRADVNTSIDIERGRLIQQSTTHPDAEHSVTYEDAGAVAKPEDDGKRTDVVAGRTVTEDPGTKEESESSRKRCVSFGNTTAVDISHTSSPPRFREVVTAKQHTSLKKTGAPSRLPAATHQVEGRSGAGQGEDEVDARIRRTAFRTGRSFDKRPPKQHNSIFVYLSVACIVVFFWKFPLFLLLFTPVVIWCSVKFVITRTVVENTLLSRLSAAWKWTRSWIDLRHSIFFPPPLPALLRMFFLIDKKLLHFVKQSVGSLMSACIIVGLLVTVMASFVLLLFEIQVELSHFLSVSVTVWNRTIASSPQLAEWMGTSNDSLQSTLESFASHGYIHMRQWLAWQINSLVTDPGGNTSQRLLDLFDQLYQSYILQNASSVDLHLVPTLRDLQATQERHLLWSELRTVASENLETIVTVLKSVWYIVSENMSVALSFLYTLMQLLFSGGTALLNMVVFITALFYLLCYSEEHYLPVKWVTGLLPHLTPEGSSGTYGKAFTRAIRSVFHASLRRALFYGFYTWLIHTTFDLPITILPSVLAAIAGAIPFIGPYWVTIPAVLELWLFEGNVVLALVVLALSLLPMFIFLDTLIYSEIEGGHPYLTGLAIAGGIYLAGLEGALIGPILLCCLLFVMEFYGDMLNYDY